MVSLRIILYNLIQLRRFPKCIVEVGKGIKGFPYIAYAENSDRVIIGNYCSFARGAIIVAHPAHYPPKGKENYRISTYPLAEVRKHGFFSSYYLRENRNFVKVGSDVFVGANAILLPGVTIGNGAIIGAGSVVTSDVPPYAIVTGVPARVIRYRYSPEIIQKLLKIGWWNWDEKKIFDNMDYFYGRVDDFIKKFGDKTEKA